MSVGYSNTKEATYLVHFDNDVVSLTTCQPQSISLVGNDRSEVSADNLHLVVVEVNSERSLGGAWVAR